MLAVALDLGGVDELVEVHHLGREGTTGVQLGVAGTVTTWQVSCVVAGTAHRLSVTDLLAATRHTAVRELLQRYHHALTGHLAQRVACAATHTNEHRLAAALLITAWQTGDPDTVAFTQHDLARMLHVRRATVSAAATRLADTGAIRYRYGTISLTDPDALERAACSCHRTAHDAYLAAGAA